MRKSRAGWLRSIGFGRTARPLRAILGDADLEHMQDMWAERGKRRRWSVAFPIVESYEISTKPYARDVFPPEAVQRLFAHPSATLRPLNDGERSGIMHLPLRFRATSNAWIAIEDEIAMPSGATSIRGSLGSLSTI
jgi:5-methylcytosine-specific restriction protein A